MTDLEFEVLQALYNEYRPTIGDYKMDGHRFYHRPERMKGFAVWIRATLSDDLVNRVAAMEIADRLKKELDEKEAPNAR